MSWCLPLSCPSSGMLMSPAQEWDRWAASATSVSPEGSHKMLMKPCPLSIWSWWQPPTWLCLSNCSLETSLKNCLVKYCRLKKKSYFQLHPSLYIIQFFYSRIFFQCSVTLYIEIASMRHKWHWPLHVPDIDNQFLPHQGHHLRTLNTSL